MKEIILATQNRGKIAEFEALLAPIPCISLPSLGLMESPAETGLSFVENALIKARFVSAKLHKPALADDSGLVVPYLNGEPGIYSSRYAGPTANSQDNIALLLQKLEGASGSERQAFFYSAIVLVQHAEDPMPLIACGQWSGTIALRPEGEGGFGYDPIFYLPSHQCTAATLPAKMKNSISHRAKALRLLQQKILEGAVFNDQ